MKYFFLAYLLILFCPGFAIAGNDSTGKTVFIKVLDSKDHEPLSSVEIQSTPDNAIINTRTDSNGLATASVSAEAKLLISKLPEGNREGYFRTSIIVSPVSSDTITVTLQRLVKNTDAGGYSSTLHFDVRKEMPNAMSMAMLDKVLKVLLENPKIEIEIAAHADKHAERLSAQRISQKRYEAIRDWLVKHGINATRLTGKGYGCSRLYTSGKHREEDEYNRRVEFKIVKG